MRTAEVGARAQGLAQRVVVAIDDETGAVAGFTEVFVHSRRPGWGYQRDTAVLAGHRGHGLGFCMKAHMARWLVADLPALERISTTTGTENAHMIQVNQAICYRTLPTVLAVQQDLDSLESRLRQRPTGPVE
ncbi:GNAT family N-acetyltransferase [Saccharothrix sp. AJ9571]|nr:GNAT family N-acetyltransferase [Saccharothrix sp. AJ9571]